MEIGSVAEAAVLWNPSEQASGQYANVSVAHPDKHL